jgi:hypothetical protein
LTGTIALKGADDPIYPIELAGEVTIRVGARFRLYERVLHSAAVEHGSDSTHVSIEL